MARQTKTQELIGRVLPIPPWVEGFHGELAAGRSQRARQEAERVLHVEGSDGEVGGCGKGHASR